MPNGTAITLKDKGGLQQLLDAPQMRQSIADVLPRHLTPERMAKMVLIACSRQPKLYECTRESIAKAIITASELGLDCSGTLGSGYLVPYFNSKIGASEVQFIPGYRGLIDLARRSQQISRIEAQVVYDQDDFVCEFGLEPKLVHRPYMGADRNESKEKIRCVYGIAELRDGSKQLEVMTAAQIEGIRKRSRAGDSGPWKSDFSEMARKTVVRRLCKYLPLSAEMEKALVAENDAEAELVDVIPQEVSPKAGANALHKKLTTKPDEPPSDDIDDMEAVQGMIEQQDAAAEQPEPEPAEKPISEHDKVVIMLMEKDGVSEEVARARLERWAGPYSKKGFNSVAAGKLPGLVSLIKAGQVTCKESE